MSALLTAGILLIAASVLSAQPKVSKDPERQDGKTIQFRPGCSGSARILETRLRSETPAYQTYDVRVEFSHSCDAPFRPSVDIFVHARRKDGVLTSVKGELENVGTIFQRDTSPIVLQGRIVIGLQDLDRGLIDKPYLSNIRAAPRQWVTPAIRAPRLQQGFIQSAAARTKISYFIYIPESYDAATGRRFPVLYWLHGSGGGLAGVPALVAHFDTAIRGGKIPPLLVVFPNGLTNSMWCDSKDGTVPMETVLVKELAPHIDATFRTIASREGRIIEGFSMGGYGAARLGFKRPDLFASISILGGGPLQREFKVTEAPRASPLGAQQLLDTIYGGDQEYFKAQSPWRLAEQNSAALRSGTLVRQVVGELDETLANNRELHLHLTSLNIPHSFTSLPGVPHNPMQLFQALGEANWEFYRVALGATAPR